MLLRRLLSLLPESAKRRIRNYRAGTPVDDLDLVRAYLEEVGVEKGTLVDVGAHVGTSLLPFARTGWQVHAFEPDAVNRRQLLDLIAKEGLATVRVDARAVADRHGEVSFYRSDVSSGISGLSNFHDSHTEAGKVALVPLRDYLRDHGVATVDCLKIDTEGHDLFVLQSLDWATHRPRAVVCEFEDRKTVPLGYTVRDLHRYLSERGYGVLISEWHPIVEYGRQHRWRQFTTELDELGERAWGNLLAVPVGELGVLRGLVP